MKFMNSFDENNPNTLPMDRHVFTRSTKLATQGMFLCNGEQFKHIVGLAVRLH